MYLNWVATPSWPSSSVSTFPSTSWVNMIEPPHFQLRQQQLRSRVLEVTGMRQRQQQQQQQVVAAVTDVSASPYHGTEDSSGYTESSLPMSRASVLCRATSALGVGSTALGAFAAPAAALDPQRDIRTAVPPPPALLLPVMKLRVATAKVLQLLGDPTRWEEARFLLSSPPFSSEDFAKILDRYSDSNWGNHILGDLYRNQGLANIKALDEVMGFALQQQGKGVAVVQDDIDDVREAGQALADSLDSFLELAPPDDLRMALADSLDSFLELAPPDDLRMVKSLFRESSP